MKRVLFFIAYFISISLYGQNLEKDTFKIKEVEVISTLPYQATNIVPVTFKNISQKDISFRNYGQEPSQILNSSPSITEYSDAGSGWGYSYIRMRGIDQTRINMSLNGVPLNEPEDQGCYFSNYPDFLESIKMLQIQRGVGMTKNGIANFGGSLNFESLNPENQFFDLSYGFGSFNSNKISVGIGSDNFYIRYSTISSDGYKKHSGNKSNSFFFITEHKINKNIFKFIGFSGDQQNKLGWLGATKNELLLDPRYNSCTNNEKDKFNQTHLQLHHTYQINTKSNLNSAVYYNYLRGGYTYQYYYDELTGAYPHTSIDTFGSIDKYNVKSNTIGFYTNYIYNNSKVNIYTGLNGQIYNRRHNGQTWFDVNKHISHDDFDYEYFNTGYRNEFSAFFKMIYKLEDFNIFHDFQYRHSTFIYDGNFKMDDFIWNFFNSTIGVEKKIGNTILYYSIGKVHREPTRNDIFMGMDNLFSDSAYIKMKPESVIDNELGIRYSNKKLSLNANAYYMKFKNEITLNGYFGPTGILLHSNVDNSFRSGLETDVKLSLGHFVLINNSSISYNKIKVDNNEYNPVLTPRIIINQDILYTHGHYTLVLTGRYQGKSYIGLSNENDLSSFFSLNGSFKISLKHFEIDLFANNLTNKKYYTNGLISMEGETLYFMQAHRNYFLNFKLHF